MAEQSEKDTIFAKVELKRTSDVVADRITGLILEGVLRNGDRLPAERDLAVQLSVSRPVVRDAIKSLEEKKLLTTRHGGGTFVSDVIGSMFADSIKSVIQGDGRTRRDFLDFRRELEGMAAEFAATRATDDDKAILESVFTKMESAAEADDFEAGVRYDIDFHMTIADCSHNIFLIHTLRSCYEMLSDDVILNRRRIYAVSSEENTLLEQHRNIFQAIIMGNPRAAREASVAHLDFVAKTAMDVERKEDWQENARLRRTQRNVTS